MKLQITMKTPDAIHEALDEENVLGEGLRNKVLRMSERWFKYGEYVTLELDTQTNTCVVLENT